MTSPTPPAWPLAGRTPWNTQRVHRRVAAVDSSDGVSRLGTMKSPIAPALAILVGLGVIGAVALTSAPGPEDRFEAYLRAVAGGEADRGWHYLGRDTQQLGYENDQSLYLRDAAAADWTAFRWAGADVVLTDDGVAEVQVKLRSPASSVPAFLIARRLVYGVCAADGGAPVAVGVFADDRFLGPGELGGGALSGSQMICNARFGEEGASASATPKAASIPTVEPSTAPTDTVAVICDAPTGSATDVAGEPDWRRYGEYRVWTTADGCLVRIDVLADRPGPEHCGWQSARVIVAAIPVGKRYSNEGNAANYVRDPDNVLGDRATAIAFDPNADLPRGAIDTGFREGATELWTDPADGGSAIYLVTPTSVERWPLDPQPAVCAQARNPRRRAARSGTAAALPSTPDAFAAGDTDGRQDQNTNGARSIGAA